MTVSDDAVTPAAPASEPTSSASSTSPPILTEKERRRKRGRQRDWVGSTIGLIVFLGGVALLVLVFRLAYDMFQTPPTVALEIQGGKALDLGKASNSVSAIVQKVILLIIMSIAGSLIANRGILMYARSDGR